jgi:hypothetical protein
MTKSPRSGANPVYDHMKVRFTLEALTHIAGESDTIGTAVSSGCFRLTNEDVIDLYDRVPIGTKVMVYQ